uniref:TSA: Wollemia nobilis Ref_Wollemi_Transcript_12106_2822 transcribed RNA sequence n=1 Tax=Wollemia nobilis TaxID=56998 RepID=A0A0C9S625_9CONI
MRRGCFHGRGSRFADSTFEGFLRKYEWRLWLGFEWSPGVSSYIRRSIARIRSRAWRWRWKIWPNQIWPSEGARKGQEFHDTAGMFIVVPSSKFSSDNPRIFSYAELYIATKGFSKDELLGSGGFGRVYKAVLPSDGSVVAVKCVSEKGERRLQKTFEAELAAVGQLRHKNLVSLKGWCFEEDELLLVYDYMPNSSLDRFLFGRHRAVLEWERRYKIVGGLAAALSYLHDQLETQIIHRDVKASNVMLDSGFNARLGDFGLARWLEHAGHEFEPRARKNSYNRNSNRNFRLADSSRIGGTIGYLSPESFQRGSKSTAKSDVFSFGIVALEVAAGRRAIDLSYPDDQIVLVDWVRALQEEGRLLVAGDGRLPDGYNIHEMNRLLYVGLLCSLNDPSDRPTMKWIIQALDGDVGLPPLPSFKALPFYASLSSGSSDGLDTSDNNNYLTKFSTSTSGYAKDRSFGSSGEGKQGSGNGHGNGYSNGLNYRRSMTAYAQLVDAPREFTFREISAATENFGDDRMVAEMDFGTAYWGVLQDLNLRVLVKRLGMKTCPALRSRFVHELSNLGRLRHRNLVQLRGWCTEKGEILVIYDYMMNRSLRKMLCYKKGFVLDWASRYRIVKGLAAGLLYLHEEWEQTVVHKSVTSSNVFLDADLNPRLGGFALAEFVSHGDEHHGSGSVRGIFGYMSPEYVESGRATTDADVFSFGVVVLEVVCGRMAVDFRCPKALLVQRIKNLQREEMLADAADVRLEGKHDVKEMWRLLNLGLVCTRCDPKVRPTMRQITHILDGDDRLLMSLMALPENPKPEWAATSDEGALLVRRMQALGIH